MRSSQRSIIDPFLVMDIMERAQAVEQKGQSVVHMEVGQPGTSAPKAAKEFLKSSMEDNPMGYTCLLYTSPSPRDVRSSRMPSSA